jgi:PTS system mannose-specific IIB component/fructoselysine and glucoselysine-specific PTS system IIB component
LLRLDDRLIHGQVVVGWGNALEADRILLIDDKVASVPWERDLYRMGVPPNMEVEFASVADAPRVLEETVKSKKRVIVVIADIDTLVRVCNSSDLVRRVNIGGLHEGEGRRRKLRYVFLSDAETESLKMLEANGVEVTARDVPTAKAIPLSEFI